MNRYESIYKFVSAVLQYEFDDLESLEDAVTQVILANKAISNPNSIDENDRFSLLAQIYANPSKLSGINQNIYNHQNRRATVGEVRCAIVDYVYHTINGWIQDYSQLQVEKARLLALNVYTLSEEELNECSSDIRACSKKLNQLEGFGIFIGVDEFGFNKKYHQGVIENSLDKNNSVITKADITPIKYIEQGNRRWQEGGDLLRPDGTVEIQGYARRQTQTVSSQRIQSRGHLPSSRRSHIIRVSDPYNNGWGRGYL